MHARAAVERPSPASKNNMHPLLARRAAARQVLLIRQCCGSVAARQQQQQRWSSSGSAVYTVAAAQPHALLPQPPLAAAAAPRLSFASSSSRRSTSLLNSNTTPPLWRCNSISSTTTSESCGSATTAPESSSSKPLVLVAGWLGAAARPFAKYVDLWRGRLGAHEVLEARPHPAALIVPPWGAAAAARDAAALANAVNQAPAARPLFVHVFSGGGFLYFGLILQALQKSGELSAVAPRLAGVVLDSSPAYVTGDVTARALLAAALREPAAGIEERHPAALGALRAGVDFYLALPPTRARVAAATAAWHKLAPPGPRLYLYSDTDALVGPETIRAHMAAEAARGARVAAHRWRDTPHVEHYRLHPEEYAAQVARFAREAAAAWREAGGVVVSQGEGSITSTLSSNGSSTISSSTISSSTISSSSSDDGASSKASSVASGATVIGRSRSSGGSGGNGGSTGV